MFSKHKKDKNNESKAEFHSYFSSENEQDAYKYRAQTVHLFRKYIELGFIVSLKSTVWGDTGGCAKNIEALFKFS